MSIKAKLLKRLEEAEKKIIPSNFYVMVFIEETEEKGIFQVQQNIYHADKNKSHIEKWTVKASSAQEVADSYKEPDGCSEVLLFMYDFED